MKAQVGRPRAYRAQGGVPIHISQRWVAPPTTSQVPEGLETHRCPRIPASGQRVGSNGTYVVTRGSRPT